MVSSGYSLTGLGQSWSSHINCLVVLCKYCRWDVMNSASVPYRSHCCCFSRKHLDVSHCQEFFPWDHCRSRKCWCTFSNALKHLSRACLFSISLKSEGLFFIARKMKYSRCLIVLLFFSLSVPSQTMEGQCKCFLGQTCLMVGCSILLFFLSAFLPFLLLDQG